MAARKTTVPNVAPTFFIVDECETIINSASTEADALKLLAEYGEHNSDDFSVIVGVRRSAQRQASFTLED